MASSGRKRGKPVEPRGREARLRSEFGYLYPGIEAGSWTPVESLINQVVTHRYGDPSQSGVITGGRLLREEPFEFRGSSPRPKGWPEELSRMSDASSAPKDGR